MTQPNDIDECALRRVNADRKLVAEGESLSAELKRLAVEDVNIDRFAQGRNAAAARESDVDTRRDDVRQTVAGDQAERSSRRAMRDLQQILIDLGRISPAIQPAGNLIDEPLGAIGVEPLGRDTCGPGLRVCESGR